MRICMGFGFDVYDLYICLYIGIFPLIPYDVFNASTVLF